MGKYDGKKLLMLGTTGSAVEIVNYARSEGAYVYVIDYLPPEQSAAKLVANEHAMISTLDVERVIGYAIEKQIDAVFCGTSEHNLIVMKKVADKLNLPCYFTDEQWNIFQNKAEFKLRCQRYGIKTARRYSEEDIFNNRISFPAVIKPSDNCGGTGVHICHDYSEFQRWYGELLKLTDRKNIIVEDYVKGKEFTAYYTIVNGNYHLSLVARKFYNYSQEGFLPLPELVYYPSDITAAFMEKVNDKIIQMGKDTAYENGVMFIQGRYADGEFVFFEAGIRLPGLAPSRICSKITGIDVVKMMTDYAMTGKMESYDVKKEDPFLSGKCCGNYILMNKGGKIGTIEGMEKLRSYPEVVFVDEKKRVGDTVIQCGNNRQRQCMIYLLCNSKEEMANTIKNIQKDVRVLDEEGNDMLLEPFDVNRLMDDREEL